MKTLFAYISLLIFGGLILLACNNLHNAQAMQTPHQTQTVVKIDEFSFYAELTIKLFPVLKN